MHTKFYETNRVDCMPSDMVLNDTFDRITNINLSLYEILHDIINQQHFEGFYYSHNIPYNTKTHFVFFVCLPYDLTDKSAKDSLHLYNYNWRQIRSIFLQIKIL